MDLLLRITRAIRSRPRRDTATDPHRPTRMSFRVWPSDLDELRHMNNGVYLSHMDMPRLDLMERSGLWQKAKAAGVYPVVVAQTITYRRSLELGQRYDVETRVAGYDDRSVFIEQRFVVGGEIFARAWVRGRFLRRRGGPVPMDELGQILGVDTAAHPVPAWLSEWAAQTALPSTRQPAPSTWD